jgi:hypothetical protein
VKNFLNNNKNIHKNAKKNPNLTKLPLRHFWGAFLNIWGGGGAFVNYFGGYLYFLRVKSGGGGFCIFEGDFCFFRVILI